MILSGSRLRLVLLLSVIACLGSLTGCGQHDATEDAAPPTRAGAKAPPNVEGVQHKKIPPIGKGGGDF